MPGAKPGRGSINNNRTMKTLMDIEMNPGRRSLKYYRFHVPGIGILRTKAKVLEAINLDMTVYCYDRIMKTTEIWNGEKWVSKDKPNHDDYEDGCFGTLAYNIASKDFTPQ